MADYVKYFKDKKITVMGLGLLGKRLQDIAFLCECGAQVLVTDLKTAAELSSSIQKLKKYSNIKYVLGEHRLEDFRNCDMVLKGQGVPLNSPYVKEAEKNNIPVEMDESLFVKICREIGVDIKVIGITGTRGKSTTTILIYEILRQAGLSVHLGGNIKGTAALPLLKKVKPGDIFVFELSSWQLQGFGAAKMSPDVAVFTNFMPDHLNYYGSTGLTASGALKRYFEDKSFIYKFQNKEDLLVLGPAMQGKISSAKAKIINASVKKVPKSWTPSLIGKHNLENIACALEVARAFNVPEKVIQKTVEGIKPIPGRLEKIRTLRGVDIYNDTNSTTPEATLAALNSFNKRVILIMGGSDKGLDLTKLRRTLLQKTKKIILLPGSGGEHLVQSKIKIIPAKNLKEAVAFAAESAKKSDKILFSPAFASFNMFKNEYDRGEQFIKIVRKLK